MNLTMALSMKDDSFSFKVPTYKGSESGSFIDHILLSAGVAQQVLNFDIIESIHSDHNPLHLELQCGPSVLHKNIKDPGALKLINNNRRLKWNLVNSDNLYEDVALYCEHELKLCASNSASPESILSAFAVVSKRIEQLLTVTTKGSFAQHPRWFDHACSSANRKLKAALKNKPRDSALIKALRTDYKKALASRKKSIKTKTWESLLDPSTLGNSSKFWSIINKPLFDNPNDESLGTVIPEDDWITHFGAIFKSDAPQSPELFHLPVSNPLQFSTKEIELGILGLSNVRLSNNGSRCAGRLELLLNGSWSSVCERSWTRSQAAVVCRQLHCGPVQGLLYRPQALRELDPSVKIWSGRFICQGSEPDLQDCVPSDEGVYNCTHEEDIFLACGESDPGTVSPATFRPTTAPQPTDAPRFRLVDGTHTCSGAVELYLKGWWGSVCLIDFPRATGELICRSLGCGTFLQVLTGSRRAPVWACPRAPVLWNLKGCLTPGAISDIESCAIRDLPRRCTETAQLICSGFLPKVKTRLVDGVSRCDGTVEVLHFGRWRPLCLDSGKAQSWGAEVCRDLHCGNVSMISQLDETRSEGRRGKAGVSCSAKKLEECHLLKVETEAACAPSRITCKC
ncbi:T-cell surface glycoprotein CD5 [Lissotriton helveticus]